MKKVICAIVINKRRNKILFVKKKDIWILPGGKLEDGESDEECLKREFKEEIRVIPFGQLRFYKKFIGKTPHSETLVLVKVYFANINGRIRPSAEISAAEWIDPWMVSYGYKVSKITERIIDRFLKEGINLGD